MNFYSSFNPAPSKAHEPCPLDDTQYILDEETETLSPVGTIPFYERIQSFYESSTISCKLAKFSMGDTTALGNSSGAFGDFTKVPNSLRDILDSRKKIEADFSALDSDIRAIFNNDFNVFESSVRDGTVNKRISDGLSSAKSLRGPIESGTGGTSSGSQCSGTN